MTSPSSSSSSSPGVFVDLGIWTRIFHRDRIFASSHDLWRHNPSGGWATLLALSLILLWKLLHYLLFSRSSPKPLNPLRPPPPPPKVDWLITEDDLKNLILSLDDKSIEKEKWDDVIEKRSPTISYKAKCCKHKDEPWKYLSVTEFANYDTDVLRDFYMDNEYRMQWDRTVVEHVQLQVDEATGTETGRTVKKMPLLTAREYVLAWRLWEGKDKTYYCVTKDCEHPMAPRNKKYVRVGFYKSGWRIRKVPGKNASEIKLIYQEDSGMNVEMAKLAFAKGVWGYICKMESALQKYSAANRLQLSKSLNAITLAQKVPAELETMADTPSAIPSTATPQETQIVTREKRLLKKPSRQAVAKGLLLLGGVICLSRGHSTLGAKVAMAYLLTKLKKRSACSAKPSEKQS
uniref:START domain-containing protein n=1 Tax=Kalanchoe fedtschenkoi TaxID=63787 RepID=A0A7N0ZXD8_KALFE